MGYWHICVVSFVVAIAVGDVLWRKIPRTVTTAGLVVGLAFQAYRGHLLEAMLAALLAFAVGLAFFSIGALGGGDVKLMTALGGMLTLDPWLFAMKIAIFVAGAMAIVQVIRAGALKQTLFNMCAIVKNLFTNGIGAHPDIHVKNPKMIRSPFGVAIAVGVIAAVFFRAQ